MNSQSLAQEVSEKKFSMLPRDYSCDILVKNGDAFSPCLKSMPEAKVKRFRLIILTKEVSKKPSVDSVLWFTFMKCFDQMYQTEKRKIQNV